MHPQERDLINSVFDRLAPQAAAPKDPEAEALIQQRARALPDSLYMLAQAVCLQEVALRQAQARIAELERQVAAPAPAASGGFLGTGGANPWGSPRTSVLSVPPQPSAYAPQPAYAPPPSAYAQSGYGQPGYAPQPAYAQPRAPWGMGGGGFLSGVAGTALGVAGGTLLAEGISNMFSGGHAAAASAASGLGNLGSTLAQAPERIVENVTVNNYYGDSAGGSDSVDVSDSGWNDSPSFSDDSGSDSGSSDF